MLIIDKYGYLENALDYIEKNIMSGRGLHKIANKARIKEDLVKNLSSALKGFSEKEFLTFLQEKIEERHGFGPGADAEIISVNISIEPDKKVACIWIDVSCNIIVDNEVEDKIKINIKMSSKNNIKIVAN